MNSIKKARGQRLEVSREGSNVKKSDGTLTLISVEFFIIRISMIYFSFIEISLFTREKE